MKKLKAEEMLEINGGNWSAGDIASAVVTTAREGINGLAVDVAWHYGSEAVNRVVSDFHTEQKMRHHHNG